MNKNPSFELQLLVNALVGAMSVESEKNFLEGFIDKCNLVLGSGNKEYRARLGSFVDKLTGENLEKLELRIRETQSLFEKDKQRLLEFLS